MAVFTTVAWANGDTITEEKLDQMVANDTYLRDRTDTEVICPGLLTPTLAQAEETVPSTFANSLTVAGTLIENFDSTDASTKKWQDIDISAVTDGEIFDVVFGRGGTLKILKKQDQDYLTVWYSFDVDSFGLVYIEKPACPALMTSREVMSW